MYVVTETGAKTAPIAEPPFAWDALGWRLHCPFADHMVLTVYFEPRHAWAKLPVDTSELNRYGEVCVYEKRFEAHGCTLRMTYSGRKRYSTDYNGILLELDVTSVELCVDHFKELKERYVNGDNHRVVAVCQRRHVYVGRAQRISDTPGGTRTYTWTSDTRRRSFGSIPLREPDAWHTHLQDALDLQRIRRYSYISPRLLKQREEAGPVECDSASFTNAQRVLPLHLPIGEPLHIQFHNLKFSPTRMAEEHIAWDAFMECGREGVLRDVPVAESAMRLTLYFSMQMSCVRIERMVLVVPRYMLTLCDMGLLARAKSV